MPSEAYVLGIDTRHNRAAMLAGDRLSVIDLTSAQTIARLDGLSFAATHSRSSDTGRFIALTTPVEPGNITTVDLALLDVESGNVRFAQLPKGKQIVVHDWTVAASRAVGVDKAGDAIVFDLRTGQKINSIPMGEQTGSGSIRISPDGSRILVSGWKNIPTATLFHVESGSAEFVVPGENDISAIAFSNKGLLFAVGRWEGSRPGFEIWDIARGRRLPIRAEAACGQVISLNFSADDKYLICGSRDDGVSLWDLRSGRDVRAFSRGETVAGHVNIASVALSPAADLIAGGLLTRARSSNDVGAENGIIVWDVRTGKQRFMLRGHEGGVKALTFNRDGRWLVSGSYDGTIKYWHMKSGEMAATFSMSSTGEWILMTEPGFIAGSVGASGLLSVVRGLELTRADQIWQALYNPDLVREHVAGDPVGEVRQAAKVLDLEKVLESGSPPEVAIITPKTGSRTTKDLINVAVQIRGTGGGIGRVEWRVNGITAAVRQNIAVTGDDPLTLSQIIALDPGENTIEVVSYNGRNLIASVPIRADVALAPTAGTVKPNLHILAIGINDYVDPGWTPPGSDAAVRFGPLSLAVKDATTFAADMKRAANDLYGEVHITLALDSNATRAKINAAVTRIAGRMSPRDSFILFAAAHGTSKDGRFYMIPQDFKSGADALRMQGIGQDILQDWFANRLKARKAIIFLDTCESGALIAGHLRSRSNAAADEAALGRLHEATGRPVLTASAIGQFAHEGVIAGTGSRHGVFTWALLDALRNADTNSNQLIELSEIVRHVQGAVPKLAAKFGGGGRAAYKVRRPVLGEQMPRFGSRGEDFAVVRRLH